MTKPHDPKLVRVRHCCKKYPGMWLEYMYLNTDKFLMNFFNFLWSFCTFLNPKTPSTCTNFETKVYAQETFVKANNCYIQECAESAEECQVLIPGKGACLGWGSRLFLETNKVRKPGTRRQWDSCRLFRCHTVPSTFQIFYCLANVLQRVTKLLSTKSMRKGFHRSFLKEALHVTKLWREMCRSGFPSGPLMTQHGTSFHLRFAQATRKCQS